MGTMLADPVSSFSESTTSRHFNMGTTTLPSSTALPSLNLGFDELRARMNSFTQRFDDFIEQGRRRVLEERNQFRMRLAQVHGTQNNKSPPLNPHKLTRRALPDEQEATRRAIASLDTKSAAHDSALAAHAAEADEMHAAIATLTATRDARTANISALRARVADARADIAARRAAQREHATAVAAQRAQDVPELERWEAALGLRIEATGAVDRVRFVFDCRGGEGGRFELDMAGRGYEVVACRPVLEAERVREVVGRMLEGEDLGGFLKGMRALFVEEMGRA